MRLLLIFPQSEVIDSIEDLYRHKDLKLITMLDKSLESYVKKGNNEFEKLVLSGDSTKLHDVIELIESIHLYVDWIDNDKTHVLMTSKPYIDVVKAANDQLMMSGKMSSVSNLYMSTNHPFTMPYTLPYRANLPKNIADTYTNL